MLKRSPLYHPRPRELPPEKDRAIRRLIAKEKSERAIERILEVSRWAVHRRVLKRLGMLAGDPLPCTPWRCPGGGETLVVDRCILHGTVKPGRASRRKRGTADRPAET